MTQCPSPRVESFAPSRPSREVQRSVRDVHDMLEAVDDHLLAGLDLVLIRDLASLSSRERRAHRQQQGKRLTMEQVVGLYRKGTSKRGAEIQIFIDQVFRGLPELILHFGPFRKFLIAKTLFHELGHHVQTRRQLVGEPEQVADEWRNKLLRRYGQSRHPWFARSLPILLRLARFVALCSRWLRERTERN